MLDRVRAFAAQPPVRKALPWFAGVAAIGLLALTWTALSPAPQRVLYSSLDDAERADVVAALDKAAIGYTIDNATGALSVDEGDLYRARMLVASEGALATPESGTRDARLAADGREPHARGRPAARRAGARPDADDHGDRRGRGRARAPRRGPSARCSCARIRRRPPR